MNWPTYSQSKCINFFSRVFGSAVNANIFEATDGQLLASQ